METKANYVAVGVFTLLLLAAAFIFVYWTAKPDRYGETAPLQVHIAGSAAGLDRGSAVLFNGVKVGQVTRVFINPANPAIAIAEAVVDSRTPVTASTSADIVIAGLSFAANVDLKGGNPQEENLLAAAAEKGEVAIIRANPSSVNNLVDTAQKLMTRADNVVASLEGAIADIRKPLKETVDNANTFSKSLADNAESIDAFLASVGELSKTFSALSGRLDSTLGAAEELLKAVDQEKVKTIVANADGFMERLNTSTENLKTVMADVEKAASSLAAMGEKGSATLEKADKIVAAVEPEDVKSMVSNFKQASDDISSLSARVNKRGEDVDAIISNAKSLTEELNAASKRVDGILAKVDALVGSDEGKGLFAEARETFKSFRQVADTLNAKLGPISAGLTRFTTTGLRDVEAFVRDGRRAINRIEGAISDFEANPQRLITGGKGEVRTFDGRQRR
ncbi:MAG: MCE family protein [Notoacmeibacter sp.]|nr:MCE family protein [Notoacmeibacter sp.]